MRSILFSFVLVTLFGLIPLAHGESPEMRPGKWEVKMNVEMAGMPQQMPPMATTHCITPEQAVNPGKDVMDRMKKAQQGAENCQITQHDLVDKTARWSLECKGAQRIESTGEITFDSDVAYHGIIKSEVQTPAGAMSMTQRIEARRVGECD